MVVVGLEGDFDDFDAHDTQRRICAESVRISEKVINSFVRKETYSTYCACVSMPADSHPKSWLCPSSTINDAPVLCKTPKFPWSDPDQ